MYVYTYVNSYTCIHVCMYVCIVGCSLPPKQLSSPSNVCQVSNLQFLQSSWQVLGNFLENSPQRQFHSGHSPAPYTQKTEKTLRAFLALFPS